MSFPEEVNRRLDRVYETLAAKPELSARLDGVTSTIVGMLPHCDAASISVVLEDSIFTQAATSAIALEVDLVQYSVDEGPCLHSIRERTVVRIDVLERDERFVHFAPGALARGVQSSLSIPLVAGDTSVASINLYSFETAAFTDQTVAHLDPVLAYITDTITRSTVFGASLSLLEGISRHTAEQDALNMAVGLLMSRLAMAETDARELVERRAAASGTSLLEAAGIVIAMVTTTDTKSGELPPGPQGPDDPGPDETPTAG